MQASLLSNDAHGLNHFLFIGSGLATDWLFELDANMTELGPYDYVKPPDPPFDWQDYETELHYQSAGIDCDRDLAGKGPHWSNMTDKLTGGIT